MRQGKERRKEENRSWVLCDRSCCGAHLHTRSERKERKSRTKQLTTAHRDTGALGEDPPSEAFKGKDD